MIIHLIVGLIKRISLHKTSQFPELHNRNKDKMKFELDLPNYATKSDLKGAKCINIWKFAKKVNLASFKKDIDDVDIDEFKSCFCWFK